jgi:hypothetical protein
MFELACRRTGRRSAYARTARELRLLMGRTPSAARRRCAPSDEQAKRSADGHPFRSCWRLETAWVTACTERENAARRHLTRRLVARASRGIGEPRRQAAACLYSRIFASVRLYRGARIRTGDLTDPNYGHLAARDKRNRCRSVGSPSTEQRRITLDSCRFRLVWALDRLSA